MSKPELTQNLIAETLKKLMKKTPLDKISIQSIVDECGLNRKTFYYHFQDKQELICRIFDREFADLEDVNQNNTIIDELIGHLYDNRDFYVPALASNVQNNLSEHICEIIQNATKEQIESILDGRKLSLENIDWVANFYANAITGTIKQWAAQGMKEAFHKINADSYKIIGESLEIIVELHAKR